MPHYHSTLEKRSRELGGYQLRYLLINAKGELAWRKGRRDPDSTH